MPASLQQTSVSQPSPLHPLGGNIPTSHTGNGGSQATPAPAPAPLRLGQTPPAHLTPEPAPPRPPRGQEAAERAGWGEEGARVAVCQERVEQSKGLGTGP